MGYFNNLKNGLYEFSAEVYYRTMEKCGGIIETGTSVNTKSGS